LSARRAIAAAGACAALASAGVCAAFAAGCGHYAAPIRSEPAPEPAAASDAAPADEDEAGER
jgi:hypothetical protein